MLVIKISIIASIILSAILTLFSTCLLAASISENDNFIFTQVIANKGKDKTYLQSGNGIIMGSSILLIISLIIFYTNYNCGFGYDGQSCQSSESDKPQLYHQNRRIVSGKLLEYIIFTLVLFLFIGLILFSIDFFPSLEEDNFQQRDIMFMWAIWTLTLTISLTLICLFIFLLIIKKPTPEKPYSKSKVDNYLYNKKVGKYYPQSQKDYDDFKIYKNGFKQNFKDLNLSQTDEEKIIDYFARKYFEYRDIDQNLCKTELNKAKKFINGDTIFRN